MTFEGNKSGQTVKHFRGQAGGPDEPLPIGDARRVRKGMIIKAVRNPGRPVKRLREVILPCPFEFLIIDSLLLYLSVRIGDIYFKKESRKLGRPCRTTRAMYCGLKDALGLTANLAASIG